MYQLRGLAVIAVLMSTTVPGVQVLTAESAMPEHFPGIDTITYNNRHYNGAHGGLEPYHGGGVKFSMLGPWAKLIGVRHCFIRYLDSIARLRVYSADGPGGSPGTVLLDLNVIVNYSPPTWYYYNLSGFNLFVTGDFFIFLHSPMVNGQLTIYDDDGLTYPGRSWWANNLTSFSEEPGASGDCMIEAVVEYHDVGATGITAPLSGAVLDSAASITPVALITNYVTQFGEDNVPARYRIRDLSGTEVYSSVRTTSLNPGQSSKPLNFSPVTLHFPRGVYTALCTTLLDEDARPANDRYPASGSHSFRIRVRDMGISRILSPVGTVDSGAPIIPQVVVKNFGTDTVELCSVAFALDGYSAVRVENELAPDEERTVSFPPWTPQRGSFAIRCSTRYAQDLNPPNNLACTTVTVRVLDVAPIALIAPVGIIDSGTMVTPTCSVHNHGTTTVSYRTCMNVGTFYHESLSVTDHPPGVTIAVEFPPYANWPRGVFPVTCSTGLTGDSVPFNNRRSDTLWVRVPDMGVAALIRPNERENPGLIPVSFRIKNYGNVVANARASAVITDSSGSEIYSDFRDYTGITPGESLTATLMPWVGNVGVFLFTATTIMSGDVNPTNNRLSRGITIGIRDAGVSRLIAPTGQVDSGALITPQAVVRNFGDFPVSCQVKFLIGDFYRDSLTVHLGPGVSDTAVFAEWYAAPVGRHVVCCTTLLAGDENPHNDRLADTIEVIPPTALEADNAPVAGFSFELAGPNPSSGWARFCLRVPGATAARLGIYSATGKLLHIRQLSLPQSGTYQLVWNGCDQTGRKAGTGVYYCHFQAGEFSAVRKLCRRQ